jgi:hypothetical protein
MAGIRFRSFSPGIRWQADRPGIIFYGWNGFFAVDPIKIIKLKEAVNFTINAFSVVTSMSASIIKTSFEAFKR